MKISYDHSSETMIDIKTISFLLNPLVKYATFDWDKFWPPRSNLTSEAKLKISYDHSLETMIDIKTISFLQRPLAKYETFYLNELWPLRSNLTSEAKLKISNGNSSGTMIDIKATSFLQSPLVKSATLTQMNFDLLYQIWPLRPNGKFQMAIARKLW